MNMSSVAREICLFPCETLAWTDAMNAFFGEVDLRIQIRQAELAATAAACGHFYNPECCAMNREREDPRVGGVVNFDFARQFLTTNGLVEQGHRVLGFASPFNNAVHAQFFVGVCVLDLPSARTADNHLKILAIGIFLDLAEELTRIV